MAMWRAAKEIAAKKFRAVKETIGGYIRARTILWKEGATGPDGAADTTDDRVRALHERLDRRAKEFFSESVKYLLFVGAGERRLPESERTRLRGEHGERLGRPTLDFEAILASGDRSGFIEWAKGEVARRSKAYVESRLAVAQLEDAIFEEAETTAKGILDRASKSAG